MSNRFDFGSVPSGTFWADAVAERVIARSPRAEVFTCAAGISPSGVVHFGNFRDIITSYATLRSLVRSGKKARLVFSWDNFDRFRKVPAGVPEHFAEHIGKPLSKVPDPEGELSSYAVRFERPLEEAMRDLGIEIEYRDETAMYESGAYDDAIFHALSQREEIADILLSFMTAKGKESQGITDAAFRAAYYPISLYSRWSGTDATEILSYDGGTSVTYRCKTTGNEESVDLSKEHIAKLAWKTDWPMRWKHEGVSFEPGGHDHASPGSSYDVSSAVAEKVFGYEPPVFAEYKFVGLQGLGAKMSGSKGGAVSPKDLLGIYDPILLKWLYLRRRPDQSFTLAFDSELYRQYDEFDRDCALARSASDPILSRVIEDSAYALSGDAFEAPIPFRQAVAFGGIVQWDKAKLTELLAASGLSYSGASLDSRLPRARVWLETYNPGERIVLLEKPNTAYAERMDEAARGHIERLRSELSSRPGASVADLEHLVYGIPKEEGLSEPELKKRQRAFFVHVYNLLIGKDTGPRLGTFLWALPREQVLALLDM